MSAVTTRKGEADEEPLVLQDLHRFLTHHKRYLANSCAGQDGVGETTDGADGADDMGSMSSLFDKSAMAVPVAAMKALLGVVERTEAETMMQLQDELRQAADDMMASFTKPSSLSRSNNSNKRVSSTSGRSHIALQSGCELFLKYITRTFLELPDFQECKRAILERGQRFQMISLAARDRIAAQAAAFVPNNGTVLTHGYSRVVANILLEAQQNKTFNKHFDVIVLEGRPDAAGVKAARYYHEAGIPIRVCLDAAMGTIMEQVDVVLTGAEAIAENGGVINKIGTYALACCAMANNKPMYVAAESYKFARLYPLRQSDLPSAGSNPSFYFCDTTTSQETEAVTMTAKAVRLDPSVQVQNPSVDFTPAKFITLLFTDLGVLTPSAVSDELIRLYQ